MADFGPIGQGDVALRSLRCHGTAYGGHVRSTQSLVHVLFMVDARSAKALMDGGEIHQHGIWAAWEGFEDLPRENGGHT